MGYTTTDTTKMELVLYGPFILCLLTSVTPTPLDDYVNRPDPHYQYEYLEKQKGPGYTYHLINMTSQKWKSGELHNSKICSATSVHVGHKQYAVFMFFSNIGYKTGEGWHPSD